MTTNKGFRTLLHTAAVLLAATALSSCGLMHDDLADCATRPPVHTNVRFVYDYNTSEEDLFAEHVGAVTLYIFDSDGRYVREIERTRDAGHGLETSDFKVDLELQPGRYHVYALAHENHGGYNSTLEGEGAKFRRNGTGEGSTVGDIFISLDHDNGDVNHGGKAFEALWVTQTPGTLEVPEVEDPAEGDPQPDDVYVEAVIPLLRVTNNVHISFYQEDFPGKIDPAHYEIWMASSRGRDRMDILGEYRDDSTPLRFTPYKTWAEADSRGNRCVNAEFTLPRLMADEAGDRTKLYIRNKTTGHVTEVDHIEQLIARGREAYPTKGWGAQEYLDREYNYDLSLYLGDETWKFATIYVNILSWSKRVQNENL